MNRKTFCLLFICALLSAVRMPACAGPTDKETTPTIQTRLLQPGDQWIYRITRKRPLTRYVLLGQLRIPVHEDLLEFSGTMTVLVVTVPKGNGPTALALQETLQFRNSNEDVDRTWLVYFDQLEDHGIENVTEEPDAPENLHNFCIAGNWSEGLSYACVPVLGMQVYQVIQDFDGNSTVIGLPIIYLNTVAGTEIIRVRAGRFNTWKVSRASNLQDDEGVITSENVWYAPEVGLPVKIVRSIGNAYSSRPSYGSASKLTETWELIKTNILTDKK